MIKLLSIVFLLFVLLDARENPFFPADGEEDLPLSTNISQVQEPLKRATLSLPSTARTIEEVTITYKNLDGSIAKNTIQLNNSIDWHLPIFVSQNYASTDTPTKIATKKLKEKTFKKIASLKYVTLLKNNKEIKIVTKDKMMRNFLLVKPHRIVCDFKRDIDIRSYVKKMPQENIVKEFRIGNHNGYYRVVIELDGYYRYKLEDLKDGYIFKLL